MEKAEIVERPSKEVRLVKNDTNVVVHDNIDEKVLIHAVQHLDDAVHQLDDSVLRVLPKKTVNLKTQPNKAEYDEFTGELTTGAHPCLRECKEGEERMICYYHFSIEWYQTMSKACYNCPYNKSDCDRKDCIPADGMNRPLNVINRKLPGPSVEVRKNRLATTNLKFYLPKINFLNPERNFPRNVLCQECFQPSPLFAKSI